MDFLNNDEVIEESLKGKIGSKIRKDKDEKSVKNDWNTKRGRLKNRTYHAKNVTDKDFVEMVELINKCKKAQTYSEYKKSFDKFCKMSMISPDGCIIYRYNFVRGTKPDTNEVLVICSNTRQKIVIPSDSRLYHNSKNDNIKELKPFFKGKSARGFLYSTPRIYLTIKEKYPLIKADIKKTEKTYLYRVKENIRTAYIDPLVPGYKYGAVYIETKFPVAVEKVTYDENPDKKSKNIKESVETIEDFKPFLSLEEFVDYYGLTLVDEDDVVEESIGSTIGSIVRSAEDEKYLRNKEKEIKVKDGKIKKISIDFNKLQKFEEAFENIKTSKDFKTYKKSYEFVCKSFGIDPKNNSIKLFKIEYKDTHSKINIQVAYKPTKTKVMLPNGSKLVHITDNKLVKELMPKFFSKLNGWYTPPCKRVYMKIDEGKPSQSASKVKYTPKEKIRTAYVDPSDPRFKNGMVFIDTDFPVPVKPIKNKDKKDV